MDLAEAFLNDMYDWDGAHEPIVAATESDMDGALTMQLFKHLTGSRCCLRTCGITKKSIEGMVFWEFRDGGDVLRREE